MKHTFYIRDEQFSPVVTVMTEPGKLPVAGATVDVICFGTATRNHGDVLEKKFGQYIASRRIFNPCWHPERGRSVAQGGYVVAEDVSDGRGLFRAICEQIATRTVHPRSKRFQYSPRAREAATWQLFLMESRDSVDDTNGDDEGTS